MSMFSLKEYYNNLGIRSKLLLGYATVFIFFLLISCLIFYPILLNSIQSDIESELNNSTKTILNTIRATANASIKNYLRAVAEKNREIVAELYKQYQEGRLSEEEARKRAESILLSQHIGKTGYIYCLDSTGIIRVHPVAALLGVDLTKYGFIKDQLRNKEGYVEYEWKNPGEKEARLKALYMTYFKPWDWIISVSSYRDEFKELVNVTNFRDSILSIRFGKTGYIYVLDSKGNVIIHPVLTGNVYDVKAHDGRQFIHEICAKKNGQITYTWRNPNEKAFRKKLAIFNYIPELDWIVVASSYEEEFYEPLINIRNIFVIVVIATLLLLFFITYLYSTYIINSLNKLILGFQSGSAGDFSIRMSRTTRDEFGKLTDGFNNFMDKLEAYNRSLKQEMARREKAEEEMREANDRYKSVLRAATEFSIIGTDTKGIIKVFNEGSELLLGYRADEVIDKMTPELIHDRGEVEARAAELGIAPGFEVFALNASQGETETREWTYIRKDGSRFPVQLSVTARRDTRGHIVGYLGVGVDITKRKRIEERLFLINKAVESASDAIGMSNPQGRHIYHNQSFADLFEYNTPVELAAEGGGPAVYSDKNIAREVFETILGGGAWSGEVEMVSKSGRAFPVLLRANAIKDEVGKVVGLVGIHTDITERKRAEQVIQSSRKSLRIIFDSVYDAIFIHDLDGTVLDVNEQLLKLYRVEREPALKYKIVEDYSAPENPLSDLPKTWKEVLDGRVAIFDWKARRPGDGSVFDVEVVLRKINLEGREVVLANVHDITERKLTQDALKKSHDELERRVQERTSQLVDSNKRLEDEIIERKDTEESLRKAYNELKVLQSQLLQAAKMASVGQLAAGVAHEINNPTSFVVSNLEVLYGRFPSLSKVIRLYDEAAGCLARDDVAGAKDLFRRIETVRQEESVDFVLSDLPNLLKESLEGAQRIQKIVFDLRTFSHFDEGNLHEADLNNLINSALNIANNELKYKVQVVKEYAILPPIVCFEQRLGQVFLNLLVNSAQAIDAQGIVKIRTYEEGEYVCAEISDTGCGMSQEVQKHLFEPFFTTKPVGKGTGLGLSLVYNIVEQHHGKIEVRSKVGEGTAFTIKLPRKRRIV